jgi:hypothetical protein
MAKSATTEPAKTAEELRLDEAREKAVPWRQWGPYLSERQWGTVREDYSEDGDAWDYFTHDQARSRAYHWGEDGLAGLSDDHQRLCFALALWVQLSSRSRLNSAILSLPVWSRSSASCARGRAIAA